MASAMSSQFPPLTKVVISTVKPLHKTAHPEGLDANFMDIVFSDLYVPSLFAYRMDDKSDGAYLQLVNRIKESLQKVLVSFFSYAGRWVAVPEGGSGRKLLCNDEGVPFIEAYVDEDMDAVVHPSLKYQEIPELQGYETLGMDFTLLKQPVPKDGLLPVFVQLTRFKCGGVALAVTFSHMHTDANGFFSFMRAWSELARIGETAVKSADGDRARGDVPALRSLVTDSFAEEGNEPGAILPRWVMKAYEVSASVINSVKQEAKKNKSGPEFVSTQDCIAAHMWSSLGRLPPSFFSGLDPRLTMVVEGRAKFYDPPLSKFFSGNVIASLMPTLIPRKDLVELPVSSIACSIRQELETTGAKEWNDPPRVKNILETFSISKIWSITSWFKFPLYQIDFGAGNPFFATRVSNLWSYSRPSHTVGGTAVGPPIPGSSAVATVSVFSTPDFVQALESDPLFLSFFVGH